MKSHLILFIIFIVIIAFNPDPENENQEKSGDIGRYLFNEDSGILTNKILGEWYWDSTYCAKEKTCCYAGFFYKISFLPDQKMRVYQNGRLVKTANWEIIQKEDRYMLVTKPAIDYVSGEVFFNNNKMRYLDTNGTGFEYYFSRKW